jgi:hypothetical protein
MVLSTQMTPVCQQPFGACAQQHPQVSGFSYSPPVKQLVRYPLQPDGRFVIHNGVPVPASYTWLKPDDQGEHDDGSEKDDGSEEDDEDEYEDEGDDESEEDGEYEDCVSSLPEYESGVAGVDSSGRYRDENGRFAALPC